MKINFVFVRHGENCQQLIQKSNPKFNELFNKLYDPQLSESGVFNSIRSGDFLKKMLDTNSLSYDIREYQIQKKSTLNINNFDFVGTSSMLRSIETAYYMSLNYTPLSIFVFPYLRECYNCNDEEIPILEKVFPLKSINEQKKELVKQKITNINYKYVEDEKIRKSGGNIELFMKWFVKNVEIPNKNEINVLIITHSKVILKYTGNIIPNNVGFILSTEYKNGELKYSKDTLPAIWPIQLYKKFDCSKTTRCLELC